jgi:membrane associated rhomboid family serine protease
MFPIHDDTARIHGRPYVNYGLIAVNVVVFIWEMLATGFFTEPGLVSEISYTYGAVPKFVLSGNIYSVLTSMFMHGGIAHVVGNMVFLFVFGDNIEDRFGHIKYLLIYFLWGIFAAFAHSIYAAAAGGIDVPAIGASGAISGVLGAYLILFPRAKILTVIFAFFITTVRIPALAFIPFWFIMQLIFGLIEPASGGVAYVAHIGGFIVGVGTGYIWKILTEWNLVKLRPSANNILRKQRPEIDESNVQLAPEILEGPDYYEIIAELRGLSRASDIHVTYEPDIRSVHVAAAGSRHYDLVVKLPETAINPTINSIEYVNGIARIRLLK